MLDEHFGKNRVMDHRRIKQNKAGGVLVVVAIVLVVLTGVLLAHVYVSRLLEHVVPGSADIVIAVLVIAWWYLAAWLAARLIRHVSPRFLFPFDSQPRRRKILSDLVSGLIYLGAFFGILKYALHQPIEGLLATSGIVAVVLGLALQSTLADLFSGIALNIEDPFRAGDWINVDGANEGQVVEINWRATRIRDRNGDTVVIPNSQIAKSRVTNHSLPERAHPSSISIDIDADSPADEVGKILISAVLDAKHVLTDPPPDVTVQAIRGRTASYCVSFYVADFADIPSAQTELLRQVLSHVANAGLRLARPQTDVFIVENSRPVTRSRQSPGRKK
jgi:small-conductance mechanosensitive channel